MSFTQFKTDFLQRSAKLVDKWSEESYVDPPPVIIVPDESLDPFEVGPIYVRSGWKHSSIPGPAIIFPEHYLSDLYEKASQTNDIRKLWQVLDWGLAHELGHHVRVFGEVTKLVNETSASLYAFSFTGRTRRKHNELFTEIMGENPSEYVTRKLREQRQIVRCPS